MYDYHSGFRTNHLEPALLVTDDQIANDPSFDYCDGSWYNSRFAINEQLARTHYEGHADEIFTIQYVLKSGKTLEVPNYVVKR